MNQYDVGVITDGELGCNVAFNLSANGSATVLYNTGLENMPREEINRYISDIQEMGILAATSVDTTFHLLKKPRVLFLISRSGVYADEILKELFELVEENDIVIDTCDANYKITAKRCRLFEQKSADYMGVGFSGGEAEALDGASFMVGGSFDVYRTLYDLFSNISSKYDGLPCCAYMGAEGAGQYVKMIHNGIEYGQLQLLAESISILKELAGCDRTELCEVMNEWAAGDNEGYFIQAVHDILNKTDAETGLPLTDLVSDKVGCSKSVVWLCNSAEELSVPVPTIYAALNQRFLSGMERAREAFHHLTGTLGADVRINNDERKAFIEYVKNGLYLSTLCVHVQAFSLLKRAADLYLWGTDLLDVAITFQGGSFIRSRLLSRVIDAYKKQPETACLFEDQYFAGTVKRYSDALRTAVGKAVLAGLPVPAMSVSLSYIDSYASQNLNTGIVELVRDYIQSSGFERADDRKGRFHADWNNIRNEISCEQLLK